MVEMIDMIPMAGARLILASTSRYRADLLRRLDVPFEVTDPAVDEDAVMRSLSAEGANAVGPLSDESLALELARAKATAAAGQFPDAYVLAADQIAVLPGTPRTLLRKPKSEAEAVQHLMMLRGKTHVLTTGVVLQHPRNAGRGEAVDEQHLTMRVFSEQEARTYVARAKPLDAVGAYHIEDAGIRLFERITSDDYTGIIGLPLLAVCRLLRRVGLLQA